MTDFVVEKDIPFVGKRASGRPRGSKYPFAAMEVDDSFAVPKPANKYEARAKMAALQSAGATWAKRNGNGHQFSVRTLPTEIRVWRVK